MRNCGALAGELADRWSVGRPPAVGRVGRPPADEADVLVVGLSVDDHLDAIAREVLARGREVSALHPDIDLAGGLNVSLRPPSAVSANAVLCRSIDLVMPIPHHGRQTFVEVDPFDASSACHGHALREATAATRCWLDLVDSARWVNEPWAAERAESKARQLRIADRHGLATPPTLVTADVATLITFADQCGGTVVHKSMRHPMTDRAGAAAGFLHTSTLTSETIAAFGPGLPHAAMFQERLVACAEYRVVVIDDRVLAARLRRSADDSPDWRRDLPKGVPPFSRCSLDATVESALVAMVAELGLVFACVDLLETPDGLMFFLEVNPSGSYRWLEASAGLPVTAVLADVLLEGLT